MLRDVPISKPIYDAMCINTYTSGKTDYSPSNLFKGAKEYWGSKQSNGKGRTVSTSFAAFRGNLIHTGMEEYIKLYKGDDTYQTEFHVEINFNDHAKIKLKEDKVIGGTVDLLHTATDGTVTMIDYKTMTTVQFMSDEKIKEYTEKANFYTWCLRKAGYRIDKVVYVAIFIDWSLMRYIRSGKKDNPTLSVPIDLWDEDKAEEMIRTNINRIEQYKDTPLKDIPYCTNLERWEEEPEYKVGKQSPDGKVARAYNGCTFKTLPEAMDEIARRNADPKAKTVAGLKVVGGEPTKCKHYCDVGRSGLCDYMEVR